uniref:Uncharacterized protein n=1 Tax=Cannabis sativa TaxID=3483 RepID=A0A803R7T8_CANSA
MEGIPSMKEKNMSNSGSEACEIETIGDSKQSAHMKRALAFICIHVKVELGVSYSGNIVALASRCEKAI